VEKLDTMVENNERLIDMLIGGGQYTHKEKTSTEIAYLNNQRKLKLMRATAGGVVYYQPS
jgi:hypothetical protein